MGVNLFNSPVEASVEIHRLHSQIPVSIIPKAVYIAYWSAFPIIREMVKRIDDVGMTVKSWPIQM
jgi:hypothetical protein